MPSASLSVVIIDENRIRASNIEDGLREAGHDNVTVVNEITGLMRRIGDIDPDVIFIDLENPNRDALEHMFQVSRSGGGRRAAERPRLHPAGPGRRRRPPVRN